jgi:DNA mismatch repair ATPase MutS
VRLAAHFVEAVREFIDAPELQSAPGELSLYLSELRALLADGQLRNALRHRSPLPWRVLQQDRSVRLQARSTLDRMRQLICEIDALVSLAEITRQKGFVLPDVVTEQPGQLEAHGLYHPFLTEPVTNDLTFSAAQNFVFLTGPNMAGKTTYLRACGVMLYLAHLGMGVPAAHLRFAPFDVLLSAIDLTDNLRAGVSFFRAEALRMKTLARALADGQRVFAILDEPFKGTNVRDALDASRAVFQLLALSRNSVFLVASHLIELADALDTLPSVVSRRFEADESGPDLCYDYIARPGVSGQRLGMRVLQQERVFDLLHHSVSLTRAHGA